MELKQMRFNSFFPHHCHPLEEVACLLLELMAFLPPQTENQRVVDHSAAARVIQWIEEYYPQKFRLEVMAADLGLSASYLSRLFCQQTGGAIHEY
ncbi:AraC family transcriptional regulator [Sodalis-like symbiont of Bactericera trigonica]|nr:AraC family transcriptional regulator [Sodalis-like symbiont of Bactericera trigonica]